MQDLGHRHVLAGGGHDGRLDRGIRAAETNDNSFSTEFDQAGLMREPASQRPDPGHVPAERDRYGLNLFGCHAPSMSPIAHVARVKEILTRLADDKGKRTEGKPRGMRQPLEVPGPSALGRERGERLNRIAWTRRRNAPFAR
jgi:hypothetical protein